MIPQSRLRLTGQNRKAWFELLPWQRKSWKTGNHSINMDIVTTNMAATWGYVKIKHSIFSTGSSRGGAVMRPCTSHHRVPNLSMWLLWLNITQRTFAFIELVWEFNFRCKHTNITYACANKLYSSLHSSCNKVTSKIDVSVIPGGLRCNLGAIYVQFRPFCGLRKFSLKVFIRPSLFSLPPQKSPHINPIQSLSK